MKEAIIEFLNIVSGVPGLQSEKRDFPAQEEYEGLETI